MGVRGGGAEETQTKERHRHRQHEDKEGGKEGEERRIKPNPTP